MINMEKAKFNIGQTILWNDKPGKVEARKYYPVSQKWYYDINYRSDVDGSTRKAKVQPERSLTGV